MYLKTTLFDTRLATKVHITQFILALVVLGLTGYRSTINTGVPGGAGQITPITASVKSLVCIGYELLTRHVAGLRKYGKLTAYMVLNILDTILWIAATGMMGYSTQRYCIGEACTLTKATIAVGAVLFVISIQPTIASIMEVRSAKKAPRAYQEEMARTRK